MPSKKLRASGKAVRPVRPLLSFDINSAPVVPSSPSTESNDTDDWEDAEIPYAGDDRDWDAFLADDDERDPLPDERDFWIDPED